MIKNFRILLIVGILLIIAGFIGMNAIDLPPSMDKSPIMELIYQNPAWIIILLTLVFAPVFEELAFRFWAAGKTKAKVVSLLLVGIYVSLALNVYWAFAFGILYIASWYLSKKKPLAGTYALAGITACCFALSHIGNFEFKYFITASPVYAGMAFVLTYLVLRFKFIYAILGHFLWNGLLLVMGGFFSFQSAPPQVFESGNTVVELKRVSAFEKIEMDRKKFYIHFSRSTLSGIVAGLFEDSVFISQDGSIFKTESYPSTYRFYSFTAKSENTKSIQKETLFRDLVEKTSLKLDTIEKEEIIYYLSLDSVREIQGGMISSLSLLSNSISSLTGKNVYPDPKSDKYATFRMELSVLLKNKNDINALLSLLEKEYGIRATSKEEVIKVIRIFE